MTANDKRQIAKIQGQIVVIDKVLHEMHLLAGIGALNEAVGEAWNALSDAQQALREEHREVEGRAARARVDKANPGFRALQAANMD